MQRAAERVGLAPSLSHSGAGSWLIEIAALMGLEGGAAAVNVYHFTVIHPKWQVQRCLFTKVTAVAAPQSIAQSVCQF